MVDPSSAQSAAAGRWPSAPGADCAGAVWENGNRQDFLFFQNHGQSRRFEKILVDLVDIRLLLGLHCLSRASFLCIQRNPVGTAPRYGTRRLKASSTWKVFKYTLSYISPTEPDQ